MAVETLRHVFKTLADPTRMRLLVLLEREELAVQELMQILHMAQSTVSRHLGILREAGLLRDRREGTFVYYRFRSSDNDAWREVWRLTKRSLDGDPVMAQDLRALEAVIRSRAVKTRTWFDALGPEWDNLRAIFDDDTQRARAITKLVPADLQVADIGTGTGVLARELALAGLRVIAVDRSATMLDAARAKVAEAGVDSVEFREGDAGNLPLGDGEVDAAFAHMVLHYVASPGEAVGEMARVVAPGGRVVVVDFVQHDREWMTEKLGVVWKGFPLETVHGWFEAAGLGEPAIEVAEPSNGSSDLPATFIATATKPRDADSPR